MGGIGLQQLFIFLFLGLAFRFQQEMRREAPEADRPKATQLLFVVYAVLTLITVRNQSSYSTPQNSISRTPKQKISDTFLPYQIRIIFRLIEYAQGYDSGIPVHEAYQYVFDSTMMLAALVLFNAFHPGRIMPGKESDFPSRKHRKAVGKNNVRGRAAAGGVDALPLYESVGEERRISDPIAIEGQNPTFTKPDQSTINYGLVREFPRGGKVE